MRRVAAAALLLLATGAVQARGEDPLAGRIAGKPERCLPGGTDARLTILDARTIVSRQSGRRIWVTHPVGACPSLRTGDTLVIEPRAGAYCRNDRFRTVTPGLSIPSAPCRFDVFVPYDRS